MRRQGLHALQPKSFTPRTTDSTHRLRCAPDRLLDQPKSAQANLVWVSDITYLALANGDWALPVRFSGHGQQASRRLASRGHDARRVGDPDLQRVFWSRLPTPGLLVHAHRGRTRQGGQYCGNVYRQPLHDHQAVRSQSRLGRTR